ncbi:MAG: DUF222 domain-containing protein [Acidimicrobiales bacterium]|nr:DUF222 domain-containing protein [Acidimicrobiales bacterium]
MPPSPDLVHLACHIIPIYLLINYVIPGVLIHPHATLSSVITVLENVRRDVTRLLAEADPDRVTTAKAAELMTLFAEIERLGAAGKVLYTRRAAEGVAWRDEGHRSAASWMAEKTQTGMGEAMAVLETAEALKSLPETTEALRRGELSGPQVKVITHAAQSDPSTEKELLQAAATRSFKGLTARAAEVRAASRSAQEEHDHARAIQRSRYLRTWADPDGAFRLDARLAPLDGGRLLSALRDEADFRFHEARKSADHEPPAAYLADALVALVAGEPAAAASKDSKHRPARATVSIRVDAQALRRGHVTRGEICHIPGVGPVPVAEVRRQLSDAWLKILVVDGVEVSTVCHVGRTVPAHVQSALEERDPTCVVPTCEVGHGLQNHHWDVDFVDCKTSTLDNLARVCRWHHDLITYEKWELRPGPGGWEWREPPGGCNFETDPPWRDTG